MNAKKNINRELLENPWNVIDELADDKTKELFELDDILVGISLKFLNYRINNNMTQTKLAQILDISQAMVSKLESGEYNPTIEQLWRISKKLNWNFSILFEENIKETQIWDIPGEVELNAITINQCEQILG